MCNLLVALTTGQAAFLGFGYRPRTNLSDAQAFLRSRLLLERLEGASLLGVRYFAMVKFFPQASVEPEQDPHFSNWVVLIRSHNPVTTFKYKFFIL